MGKVQLRSQQIGDGEVCRADLNTGTSGKAVVARVVAGANVSLSSTGADAGTGDVTIGVNTTGLNADTVDSKHASDLVLASSVGAANGVASLGSDAKVPASQLPASSVGSRTLWAKTDTSSVNNTTTETSAAGSGAGSRIVAANSMAVGTTFRVVVCGKVYSTASAKAIKIAVKLGSVPLFDYTLTPGIATKGFRIEAIATVRSTGATGSIVAAGAYLSQTTCLGAAPLATATIDTTVDQAFDVTVAPAQANSGDGADVVLATIERLN